ncbi:FMN-binding protein [Cohnella endophytica]|uniref:FMN-binding protein n=1 Tax=Cohnella endophytica TaxID=2419778 RepID=A0A494Y2S9_9BACL|nr:FMN-binding protein [Cohnella endophytica]RKP56969.1 FMN-binding protein [Cohnella endophytica]
MAKMNKKWVVLCSAALGAIYAAEYFATEAQALPHNSERSQLSIPSEASSPINSAAPTLPPVNNVAPSSPAESAPTPSSSKKMYNDGSYIGIGSNRRGSIEVTVTIQHDKITDVEISRFAMHYSDRDVVGLPDEVLQKQSAQVDNVSGATYSVRAFEDAVQEALSQAKNA